MRGVQLADELLKGDAEQDPEVGGLPSCCHAVYLRQVSLDK
jgi:hypothetical protein